ncbi:Glycosyl hydrolase family 85 [Posidoniimonas polymericola]|uniref:Glycosyl hydrolase family 85 n=1 Tax=Posidoniimonas polymericola TaxID=2528002 RepID=A0A5C5YUU3_9BACT|nr:glycoside hydrolase [Posidoniimonas polymericola]TWT78526.1 Glycosyl hydrolase family 85 [Posidoniimonas polymericola]
MRRSDGWRLRGAVGVTLGLMMAGTCGAQLPGQPYANYWKPDTAPNSLASYNPAADPDAPFNLGSVPLATRFSNPALQANPHARPGEARVMSLAAFAPTSNNPSQGANDSRYYAFSNWQYVDSLVFWGGSAGEGNILAPNGPVIDAAHRNGVPVYGNIFFPPNVFGGSIDRLEDLVQTAPDGSYPQADKLIEIAERHRFDGWFVNQETNGASSALASQTRGFLRYLQSKSDLEIVWYDSMIESGPISWQGALNSSNDEYFEVAGRRNIRISDSMFLDFRWSESRLASSNTLATELGRDPYELYAGVNVEGAGWNQTGEPLDQIFPEGQPHRTSVGFYRPEWTLNNSGDMSDFQSRDTRFWSGAAQDPSDTSGTVGNAGWKGIAHYVPERSPITGGPFVTNFNLGQGSNYYIDGRSSRRGDWNNLSLQDITPTWRWLIENNSSTLTPEFDFTDAFYGGSSLRVHGGLNEPTDLRLYMTNLPVSADTNLQIALKTGLANAASGVQVLVAFADNPTALVPLSLGDTTTSGWDLQTVPLGQYAGKTIAQIGLRFDGQDPDYDVRVGRLGVIEGEPDVPAAPSDVTMSDYGVIDSNSVTLRLHWEHSPDYAPDASNEVYYYNLFATNIRGVREFLGGTLNNSFFVRGLDRFRNDPSTRIEVVAVGNEFGVSEPASFLFSWVNPDGLPGDFNRDGVVDAADYTVWRDNLGASEDGGVLGGNGAGGTVGADDYDLWRSNFGAALPTGSESAQVPEPTGVALSIGLALAASGRRGERRQTAPANSRA